MKAIAQKSNRSQSFTNLVENESQKYLYWQEKPEKLFEQGQFELWYQPVYESNTGVVLHNEVLLRWRDEQGNLYLPSEFMPDISSAGLLARVDRLVISKTINCLAYYPELQLSVNISESTFKVLNLIQDLQTWLNNANVEPKRLSLEITESAIASDSAALQFIQELKNLGCYLVIDDFCARQLSLVQCEELKIDAIKINHQFLPNLNTALGKAILAFSQSIAAVTAKYISDDTDLQLVKQAGLKGLQGNHLKMPASHPELSPWNEANQIATITLDSSISCPSSESHEKSSVSKRLVFGTTFIALGAVGLIISLLSVSHRLSNLIVDNGRINAQSVRLRAPIDGKVQIFYSSPGTAVKRDRVLARIVPSKDMKQELPKLEQEVQSLSNQLVAVKDSVAVLKNRLHRKEGEYQRIWEVEISRNNQDIAQKQAILDKNIVEANAARTDFNRLQKLYEQGVVIKQRVNAAKANWEMTQARVKRTLDALKSSREILNASQKGKIMNIYLNWGNSLIQESNKLRQQIEKGSILTKTLKANLEFAKKRLAKAQIKYNENKEVEIKAPLSAVIYTTKRGQGELIERSEEIFSLINCNNIWVEAIVDARKAIRIDSKKPVLVNLAGEQDAIRGQTTLIQPIDSQGDYENFQRLEVKALLPIIGTELIGKPLSIVKVNIPPPKNYAYNNKFCGLGQPARLTFSLEE
jgi:membrane fusion protein, multidrug efflux system